MDGQIISILQFALDGVSAQQTATANNIANAQTPNYTAEDVTFEQSLANALKQGGTASITERPSLAAPGTDGNNVSLTTQLIAAEDNTLQYQVLTDAVNAQIRLVQGATGGSFA